VTQNGTMFQKLIQYMQLALQLAAKAAPEMVQGLSNDIMQTMGVQPSAAATAAPTIMEGNAMNGGLEQPEHPFVERARAQAAAASQPEGGGA